MRKRATLNDADREQLQQIVHHYPAHVRDLTDAQALSRLMLWGLVREVPFDHYTLTDAGTVAARELGYLIPF